MTKQEISENVASSLNENPGQLAREVARELGIDKKEVNSVLYGLLKGQFQQDKEYQWWPKGAKPRSGASGTQTKRVNTALTKLCQYYLACMGRDDESGAGTFAYNQYGQPDYVELESLPIDGDDIFQSPEARTLLNKMRNDRGRLAMHLGYPTNLKKIKSSRSSWEGFIVEPVLLFPIDFGQSRDDQPKLEAGAPIVNMSVLKQYTNAEREAIMDELIQLEDELGISNAEISPDLDELSQRLQAIRSEWPWAEEVDPDNLNQQPILAECTEPGIYNRAVLIISERSPFTKGLENELSMLSQKEESDYKDTALGKWLTGNIPSNEKPEDEPLLEVLPLNVEQRQAIKQSLHNHLTIITGPPGTGKSQVVSNLLINAAWKGKRVLFASKNNKAVDVVETRVNSLGPRPVLLRVGSNQYQSRLAEYLISLMSATTSEEDNSEFQDLLDLQKRLDEKLTELHKLQQAVINTRNKLDELEQSIGEHRESLSEEIKESIATFSVVDFVLLYESFRHALARADKAKQGIFTRIIWGMMKKPRLAAATTLVESVVKGGRLFSTTPPEVPLSEQTISQWHGYTETLGKVLRHAKPYHAYLVKLNGLQAMPRLELLSRKISEVLEQSSSNAEKLWYAWLRLQPARLSSEDRNKLSSYNTILKMVLDTGADGKLSKDVYIQYQRLFPKIAHLLPCWAVTSLSAKGKIPFEPGYFDLVVIDEASQCDIASALPLLYRAKNAVIIGDPKQLSHISGIQKSTDQQLLGKYDLLGNFASWAYSYNSLFDLAVGRAKGGDIINLRDHHRSHADIIGFSNSYFYENRLRVATRYDRLKRPSLKSPGIRWVNQTGNVVRPGTGGAVNADEANAIVHVIKKLVIKQGYLGSIGVVTPFRAHANIIREKVLNDNKLAARLSDLEFLVDTVHKFQGDERDVMIFSPVVSRNMPKGASNFLRNNGNLFNVAITRARAMLIVVGDLATCSQSPVEYLSEFAKYVQKLEQDKQTGEDAKVNIYGPEYPAISNPEQVSDWERILYQALYNAGIRTLPQYSIEKYALDLALIDGERRLDIEVDGEKYHRNWNGEYCYRDQIRNQRMFELGWDVMRFWVYEVRDDLNGCIARTREWLNQKNS